MLLSSVLPALLSSGTGRGAILCLSDNYCNLLRPRKERFLVTPSWREELFSVCYQSATRSKVHGALKHLRSRGKLGLLARTQAKLSSGEDEGGEGDRDVQDLLVDLLRLETGKVRVNEFVEDRSKFLAEIAEQANEEFDRIAEEARKSMDEAGSKVLEQIDAEAADFEEELAAARAEMEANERELDEFEKNVEKARSEGLFFKTLFSKPSKPWKARSPEEQREIKEEAKAVTDALDVGTKKAAGSKLRRSAYVVMIIVLILSVVEGASSESIQWTRLIVCVLLLVGLVVQLTYETLISIDNKKNESN